LPQKKQDAVPNIRLYNLRDARAETQEQTATALNALAARRGEVTGISGNHVSRWERGIVHPSRLHCQLLAEHFGVTVTELGLIRQRIGQTKHPGHTDPLVIEDDDPMYDPRVLDSRQAWLHIRRSLNARHLQLAQTAAQLYPIETRLDNTGLLARPDWLWQRPIDVSKIKLSLNPVDEPAAFDGTEEFAADVRPLRAPGVRFQRYSHAIRDVAQPRLFENRPCWRLLNVVTTPTDGHLQFGLMNYFDAMDTCEAIAHETAAVHLLNNDQVAAPTWRKLNFRRAVGDPFDLHARRVLISINTLTIRRERHAASVILHNRSAASVATSGGVIGVMPAGVFQPSTVRATDHSLDFDLWRNIMREYSEEYLGNPEHGGDGKGADYTSEPFKALDTARRSRRIRVYALGLAVGALDLWTGLETVAVIDADVFDDIFAGLVRVNDEGSVMRIGKIQPTVHVPFTRQVIDELWATGRLAPETAYSLRTALKYQDLLLS
jgi:transcriptional regulator with XRE-family HTH domain